MLDIGSTTRGTPQQLYTRISLRHCFCLVHAKDSLLASSRRQSLLRYPLPAGPSPPCRMYYIPRSVFWQVIIDMIPWWIYNGLQQHELYICLARALHCCFIPGANVGVQGFTGSPFFSEHDGERCLCRSSLYFRSTSLSFTSLNDGQYITFDGWGENGVGGSSSCLRRKHMRKAAGRWFWLYIMA